MRLATPDDSDGVPIHAEGVAMDVEVLASMSIIVVGVVETAITTHHRA